jgi:hypothetical protein
MRPSSGGATRSRERDRLDGLDVLDGLEALDGLEGQDRQEGLEGRDGERIAAVFFRCS